MMSLTNLRQHLKTGLLTVIIISLLAVITNCAQTTLGHSIKKDLIQDIIKGRTTKEEVVKMFGQPYRTNRKGDTEILSYKYITKAGVYQELIVTIENGVVSTFSSN